jgi:hypothetical protein
MRLAAARRAEEKREAARLAEAQRERERREAAERETAEREAAVRTEAEREATKREAANRAQTERERALREAARREEAEREKARREQEERKAGERQAAKRAEAKREAARRAEEKRVETERLDAQRLELERAEAKRQELERAEARRLEEKRLHEKSLEEKRREAERIEARRRSEEKKKTEREEAAQAQAVRDTAQRETEPRAPAPERVTTETFVAAQPAEEKKAAGLSTASTVEASGPSRRMMLQIGAGALVAAVVAFFFFKEQPSPSDTGSKASLSSVTANGTDAPVEPAKAPISSANEAPAVPPDNDSKNSAGTSAAGNDGAKAALVSQNLRSARLQLSAGRDREALAFAEKALQLDSRNAAVRDLLSTLSRQAQQAAQTARSDAIQLGAESDARDLFVQATQSLAAASRVSDPAARPDAIRSLWLAEQQFADAGVQARREQSRRQSDAVNDPVPTPSKIVQPVPAPAPAPAPSPVPSPPRRNMEEEARSAVNSCASALRTLARMESLYSASPEKDKLRSLMKQIGFAVTGSPSLTQADVQGETARQSFSIKVEWKNFVRQPKQGVVQVQATVAGGSGDSQISCQIKSSPSA